MSTSRGLNYQIMEDSHFSRDGEVEMNKVDIICSGLEDVGLLRERLLVSVIEPVEQQIRILDHDQRLHDHCLEELLDKTFLDLVRILNVTN